MIGRFRSILGLLLFFFSSLVVVVNIIGAFTTRNYLSVCDRHFPNFSNLDCIRTDNMLVTSITWVCDGSPPGVRNV